MRGIVRMHTPTMTHMDCPPILWRPRTQIDGAFTICNGNVSEWVYDTEIGFGGTDYWSYTPDSSFGLLRGGGFYDQPEQPSNYFVFEQMDRVYAQIYAGFRLVRRLEH